MQNKFSHLLLRRFTWVFIAALLVGLAPANVHAQASGGVLAGDGWLASYWNNISLSGAPVLTRVDADVNFDWGVGSPAARGGG